MGEILLGYGLGAITGVLLAAVGILIVTVRNR